jgi:hypothetical protein
MTTTKGSLVRQDCIGRIRFGREQRDMLLEAYEASGLSGPRFAAQHGVKYQTFATWLQARRRQRGGYPRLPEPEATTLVLAEVEGFDVGGRTEVPVLEIGLPGGAVMSLRHAGQAALAVELASDTDCASNSRRIFIRALREDHPWIAMRGHPPLPDSTSRRRG